MVPKINVINDRVMEKMMMFDNTRYNELVEMIFSAKTNTELFEVLEFVDFRGVGFYTDVEGLVGLFGKQYAKLNEK